MAMGIGFDYSNFISSYGMQRIPQVNPQDINPEATKPESRPAVPEEGQTGVSSAQDYVRAPRTAKLEDVSLTFNKQDDFGTIGMDVDIAKLDMEKVVSDSKRDTILAGYKTFVGPTPEQMVAEYEDGLVIPK
ncbi:hypothetical protein SAMN02910292_00100 [Lachnospiraceae bacterium XBB2008]|nr:hypothetical protein [Lachnospiraceae bacterium]SCX80593.1 hypothetical protein SAMN02910292_00100 [Lachnospiraceae bacterium XBB2008]